MKFSSGYIGVSCLISLVYLSCKTILLGFTLRIKVCATFRTSELELYLSQQLLFNFYYFITLLTLWQYLCRK